MSVQIIERRYCDVCEREYEADKPDWMILSAPNAPEGVDAAWDFCSYDCLVAWITTDEADEAGPTQAEYSAMSTSQVQDRREQFHVEQPDGTPPPPAEVRRIHEGEKTREQFDAAAAQAHADNQAKLDAAMAEMRNRQGEQPSMTLMEALASGKLNFNRGPE